MDRLCVTSRVIYFTTRCKPTSRVIVKRENIVEVSKMTRKGINRGDPCKSSFDP